MTKAVTINEAKSQLQKLLSFAEKGNEIIITQNNKPLARLVPVSSTSESRIAGLNRGKMSTGDDFDLPLKDEYWLGLK